LEDPKTPLPPLNPPLPREVSSAASAIRSTPLLEVARKARRRRIMLIKVFPPLLNLHPFSHSPLISIGVYADIGYVYVGVDYVQEHFLGQGKQDNESAFEQAKDDKIADFVRGQYKSQTGKDIPGSEKS
jgi:hypothetical protein